MTTRTATKTKWIPGTQVQRKPAPKLPNVQKPFTCDDDAGLMPLVKCYGYLVLQPNGHLWLTNLVPKHQREIVADRIRSKLTAAKAANRAGDVLTIE